MLKLQILEDGHFLRGVAAADLRAISVGEVTAYKHSYKLEGNDPSFFMLSLAFLASPKIILPKSTTGLAHRTMVLREVQTIG